jgi:hypothetical protein
MNLGALRFGFILIFATCSILGCDHSSAPDAHDGGDDSGGGPDMAMGGNDMAMGGSDMAMGGGGDMATGGDGGAQPGTDWFSSLETNDPQPAWMNTVETDASG